VAVFGSLKDLFKSDDWSGKNAASIGEMLDLAAAMFDYASLMIFNGADQSEAQASIYDRDKRINLMEREIRRSVVLRLSTGAKTDVASALIFTNVVKDCERIGDYVKNLYDVAHKLLPADIDRALYREHMGETADAAAGLFSVTRDAFVLSDESRARDVISRTRTLQLQTEAGIAAITRGDMRTNDAVCIVLGLRFYKRILGHMSNIASSVVMPVDLMDFFDEPTA